MTIFRHKGKIIFKKDFIPNIFTHFFKFVMEKL